MKLFSKDTKRDELKRIPLFANLPKREFDILARNADVVEVPAGTELVIPSPEVQRHAGATMDVNASSNAIPNGGEIEWAALVRELDREEPSYRD